MRGEISTNAGNSHSRSYHTPTSLTNFWICHWIIKCTSKLGAYFWCLTLRVIYNLQKKIKIGCQMVDAINSWNCALASLLMTYKNTQLLQVRKSFMIPCVNFIEIHFSVSFLDGLAIVNYFPVYSHPVLQLNFIAFSRWELFIVVYKNCIFEKTLH